MAITRNEMFIPSLTSTMVSIDLSLPQTQPELTLAKLTALRQLMAPYQLDGYLVPGVDQHLNLASPEALRRRAWMSGFTGSAGDLLVVQDTAWLFVDSRYHERAELEVERSLIHVAKLGLAGHPTLADTFTSLGQAATQQQKSFRLGFDPFTLSIEQFHVFLKTLPPLGVELAPIAENLVDQIRVQRPWIEFDPVPAYGHSPLFHLPQTLTGETTPQKLARVRQAMQSLQTTILPLTNLNQIAWLFNLRGWDVSHIPLFIAYAIITLEQAFLFTNLQRIPAEVQQELERDIILKPYELYPETLTALIQQNIPSRVLIDPKQTTTGTYQLLLGEDEQHIQLVFSANPIEGMKAQKNAIEVEQMRLANLKASRAKVRALKWLSDHLEKGQPLSEVDVVVAMEKFYREEADFQQLSFPTISGAGANSSIVHYGTPNPHAILQSGSLLLLDSGVQYLAGTTDDTRTISLGEPTPLQIERYTAVLMAHINCAKQQFPKGTTGMQLDAIARAALWQVGLDYGHGTGHGVGAFLSGHEGPQRLSQQGDNDYPILPGMVTSIEPGYYEPGWGGIRLENLYVVKQVSAAKDATWYGFEPLTFIPFDKHLINFNRLSKEQREWLEHYHQTVIETLIPSLSLEEAEWLKNVCQL